jgi:hypothetical protein
MNLYDFLDQTLNGATGGRTGFRELCQPEPMFVSEEFASLRVERIQYINEFFTSAIAVFRAALDGDLPPVVLEFLLNDAPRNLGFEYHRELESALLHRPRFLRTDEGMSGQVMEFQCPGSGWGDLELLRRAYIDAGCQEKTLLRFSPADRYVAAVQRLTGHDRPSVLQLLDNASAPVGMRYHIASTSSVLRYWGYDLCVPRISSVAVTGRVAILTVQP